MAVGYRKGGGRYNRTVEKRERPIRPVRRPGRKKLMQMPSAGGRARATFFFFATARAGAMSKKSRNEALNVISTWNTEEVLCLLQKNELEECCNAVAKRQIDGDELLHLTDGKLALWKNDLTRPLIGKLWAFVEELNKTPEKHLPSKTADAQQNNDYHSSDNESWGTDFEDEAPEENSSLENKQEVAKPSLIKSRQAALSQNNNFVHRILARPPKRVAKPEDEEETYANCESCQNEEENVYANFQETKPPPPRNVSRLHSQNERRGNMKEESKLRNDQMKKPVIGPKPETLSVRKVPMPGMEKKLPQSSFLHNAPKVNQRISQRESQRRMAVPPPPEPKKNKDYAHAELKKPDKELPKPPAIIRNFDLVANLPGRTEESEDEYETFDENVVEQVQKIEITRTDSKLSLQSGRQGSVESVYKAPSATSHEEEEEDYEIYESITEAPEDNDYLSPIQRTGNAQGLPPPLPSKPPLTPPLIPPNQRRKSEKFKERSPDKKSTTLPPSGSNNSLSIERATRPLPPPPERQTYQDKPWFHNVTREQANQLITEQGNYAYNNQQDGYFLLRPSTTNLGNPLTLVVWCKDRVHNVPVRKRNDNRYALGTAKVNERSFSTIEEIVPFYMNEELELYSSGVRTGSTKLTDTPPK